MVYVKLPADTAKSWQDHQQWSVYKKWLDENILEGKWEWHRGDIVGTGVWLPTEEDAVMFKLTFKL
jgi:hypothetical protein